MIDLPRICLLVCGLVTLPAVLLAEEDPQTLTARELIEQIRPAVATIRVSGRDGDELGIGTGFVIDADGLIATNFHVINEGRSFTIELSSGRKLSVVAVEASDRVADLALVRVDVQGDPLPVIELADPSSAQQGMRVLAFGNPLGLRDSVVEGIVSAIRDVEGREMIQLAMPVEPGNSGGPLVDMQGKVHGIINMKSAIDDNLGFAIPIGQLTELSQRPNPVVIDRWVRLSGINEDQWSPLLGAEWQQRGAVISARGLGQGFGGRSLCLSTQTAPEMPYEITVQVRLDDESGAAGLAFCSDGKDRHYGFYPSNGRLRLTCFLGPSVYSWQVLQEVDSDHYLPGGWNRLRVRVEEDGFECFVNERLVVASKDQQLKPGRIGLVKFRDTNPDFKGFQIGRELKPMGLSGEAQAWLEGLLDNPERIDLIPAGEFDVIGDGDEMAARRLMQRARQMEQQAERIRKLAADVRLVPTLKRLQSLFAESNQSHQDQLLRGALLIAQLDDDNVDVDAYCKRVDEMADEIRAEIKDQADDPTRLEALDEYLFEKNGFRGGRAEYYHPANSHLHRVIDDREGLPITLSILYIELAKRLEVKIEGVGLPGHFVVKFIPQEGEEQLIDVFESGQRMSRRDAEMLVLGNYGRPLVEQDLRGQSSVEILTRVLRNLLGIASGARDGEALRRYAEALVAIDPGSTENRMMRAQLRGMTGRRTAAIEDLDWLLEKDPSGFNRDAAIQMRDALLHQE